MRGTLTGFRNTIVVSGLVGLAFAASPAHAADDGYANVFSSLFSAVGVIKPDPGPDIAYRERPPLVIPPQPGLPKPADGAKHSAAWPNDPDVMRHRKEAEEARAPISSDDRNEVLSASELAKGRGQAESAKPGECNVNATNKACLLVSPDDLKAQGDAYAAANPEKTDEVVAGREPPREYLTQPPRGYMKATRTLKATAEAPAEREDPANPRNFLKPSAHTDE